MVSSSTKSIPQISIIIRTKNEERFIGQTLAAIFEQDIALPFEVIVIDSGSTDRTLEIVRKFRTLLYKIEPGQFTFGYALNYGAQLAGGQYLINLSAHCIPTDSEWMVKLLTPLWNNPSIAATYGKQVPIKGLNPFEERLLIAAFTPDGEGKIIPPFSNSNCAVRKTAWEKYPFDEKASFAEDFVWSRVLPTEYQIKYVADAPVYHTHPLTFNYWAKRCYDNGILVQYLEHVYGLKYPWQDTVYDSIHPLRKRILGMVRSYAAECHAIVRFLLANGYLGYIPVLPIYVILERYYYYKGLAEGRKLYEPSKRLGHE